RAIAIDHAMVGCVLADQHPRLEACLDPAAEVSRARVHFRAEGTPNWYFVDMALEGACHRATLPRPLLATRAIDYYVEAANRSFLQTRTGQYRARVVATAAECEGGRTPAAAVPAAQVVVRSTAAGAAAVPAGFSPSGLAG